MGWWLGLRLAQAAGSQVVGIGTLVEKIFEGGRAALAHLNVPIHSLAVIERMDETGIYFVNDL
jgi:xanthine phosphoribosyltransferase